MTASITWNISTLERYLSDGTVYTVHYTITAEDQGEFSSAYGSVGLGPADPDNFIDYADLDKTTVIDWVKTQLGDEQVANVEASLRQQIQDRSSPRETSGVPW